MKAAGKHSHSIIPWVTLASSPCLLSGGVGVGDDSLGSQHLLLCPKPMVPNGWGSRLPFLNDAFCLAPQSAVWQKVLKFPWCGWLISGADASFAFADGHLRGVLFTGGRGGQECYPDSTVYATLLQEFPAKLCSFIHNSCVYLNT